MATNQKYIDLAKKLNELAKQGEGGEQINAKKMLQRVMEEHGINPEDIDDTHVETRWVSGIEHRFTKLFRQVVSSVLGSKASVWKSNVRETNSKTVKRGIDCNVAQYVEIEWKFRVYCEAWDEEVRVLHIAFTAKHQLYSPFEEDCISSDDLSAEEKEMRRRAARMAAGVKDRQIQKQIEG